MKRMVSVVCVLLGAAPLAGQDHHAGSAAQIFGTRCATCHTVPDPAFATDRAWLARVKVTA